MRDEDRFGNVPLATLFALLHILTYWFNAISLGVVTVLFVAYSLLVRKFTKPFGVRLAMLALVMAVCAGGLAVAMPWSSSELAVHTAKVPLPSNEDISEDNLEIKGHWPMPVKALITDSLNWDYFLRPCQGLVPRNVPLVLVGLAFLALILARPPNRGFWLAGLGVFYLLSLGPFVKHNNRIVAPEPVYTFLYDHVPLFARFLWPNRFVPTVTLCLIALAAGGGVLLRKKVGDLIYAVFLVVVTTSLLVETKEKGFLPFATCPFHDSAIYGTLKQEKGVAVMNLPLTESPYAHLYQPLHERPMLGGNQERAPWLWIPEIKSLYENNSFVSFLTSLNKGPNGANFSFLPADKLDLERLGYKYILLYPRYVETMAMLQGFRPDVFVRFFRTTLRGLFGAPIYQDSEVEVHVIQAGQGQPDQEASGQAPRP
jgi:hypothetical protein